MKYWIWVKTQPNDDDFIDSDKASCLAESVNWNEAVDNLSSMSILEDGIVPSFVEYVEFYDALHGDHPVATYHAGDIIEKKVSGMGRPSQGRKERIQAQVTPEIAAWLEAQKQTEAQPISDVIFRLLTELKNQQ